MGLLYRIARTCSLVWHALIRLSVHVLRGSGRAALPRDSLIGPSPSVFRLSSSSSQLEMGEDPEHIYAVDRSAHSSCPVFCVIWLPVFYSSPFGIKDGENTHLVSSTTRGSLLDLQHHTVHLALPSCDNSMCSTERRSGGLPIHGCY